jgi:Lysophospholipase L1 and related esterases
LSGETTAGGKNRIDWILKQPVDIFVLELGGNDGLRGIPISETRANLQEIIDRVRAKNPEVKIVLAGMQVPPNMGRRYAQEFQQLFRDLAQKNTPHSFPSSSKVSAAYPNSTSRRHSPHGPRARDRGGECVVGAENGVED